MKSSLPVIIAAKLVDFFVVIEGSAGIGLETARRARLEGAEVVLTGRNAERLAQAAQDVGARSTSAFDVNDVPALTRFFDGLPAPIDC